MSFLAIIPIWLGCLAGYLGSERQQIIQYSINKKIANALLVIGFLFGCLVFSLSYSITSSLLASLVVLMLALVCHTILSVYVTLPWLFNAMIVSLLCLIAGVNYVA